MNDESLQQRIEALEFSLQRVERQQASFKRELRQKSKLWDTVCSPPWQRFWWFLQGYRLWKVGRWRGKTKELK